MKFGFSSADKLKRGWQFDIVFRTGRRETGELVRLFFLQNSPDSKLIGVAVGKKIANSPQRARGRRVLREALRRLKPWIKDDIWLVASLREQGLNSSAKEVYEDIAALLKRRNLMNEEWPGIDWDVDRKKEK